MNDEFKRIESRIERDLQEMSSELKAMGKVQAEHFTRQELQTAELTRTNEILNEIKNGMATKERVDSLEDALEKTASKDAVASLADRVQSLESWQTWTFRIVLGLVITAVITAALATGAA